MAHPESIVVVKSEGEECWWCDSKIATGELCVRASFKLPSPLGISLGSVSKVAHGKCAIECAACLYRAGTSITGPAPTYSRERKPQT